MKYTAPGNSYDHVIDLLGLGEKALAIGLALILHTALVVTLLSESQYEVPTPLELAAFDIVMLPTVSPKTNEPAGQQEAAQAEETPPPPIEPDVPPAKPEIPLVEAIIPPVEPIAPVVAETVTPLPSPVSLPRRKPPPKIIQQKAEVAPPVKQAVKTIKTTTWTKPATGKVTAPTATKEQFSAPIGKANFLNNKKPVYPIIARRRGMEGLVLLRVDVDKLGCPLAVKIKRSSGYKILDRSALLTVQTWRFIPAKRGNVAVRASVDIPIRFSLVNS